MDHNHSFSENINTFDNFFEEEKQSPSFRHLSNLHINRIITTPSRDGSGTNFISDEPASPLSPQSPDSWWSRSPVQTPYPSQPSLLYCCICSLHRDGDIYSIAVLGDLVFTGSDSRRVHAWRSSDCHARGYIQATSGEVRAMVAHGGLLFTSHKDYKIRVWSMRSSSSGSSSSSSGTSSFKPRKVTTLPNASHFKSFISRKKPIGSLHKDIISCMAYYVVESILYTASFDTTVKAWRVDEKKSCIDSFIAHDRGGSVNDMVINQQNGYLFTCSSDGTIKMWLRVHGEINSHALIKVLSFHGYPIRALALVSVSPSQEVFLYAGSSDGSINYWEQELSWMYTHGGVLQGHRFAVLCLATLENMVISGSEDSTIRIWKRGVGGGGGVNHECLAVLEGHRGPVRCLAVSLQKDKFAVKSFLVYSAGFDRTFKVWRVKLLPNDKKRSPFKDEDKEEDMNNNNNNLGFDTRSPVLSPSWVKKKLHTISHPP